jgi:isopentenyl diphosphate isomerase/L-lactate dehydrogenase-like FMN-dependent dehydrogenase
LAAAGEPGVARAIELLGTELRTAMTLLGAPSIADIRRHHVV